MINALAIILHLLAINIWVGGMFFIIMVLGKVSSSLELPAQHDFWQRVLRRFFFWVWLALVSLLGSGIGMIFYRFGGLATTPGYIRLMATFGLLMAAVFLLIYFVFYQHFTRALQRGDQQAAGYQLRVIRWLGIINMLLGLCVVLVIGGGPHFSG